MNQKLSFSQRGIINVLAAILGLGFLVVLAFSLNALFASHTQQTSQTAKQLESEKQSGIDGSALEEPSPTADVGQTDPTVGWETYIDTFHHFSIKYPPDWFLRPSEINKVSGEVKPATISDYDPELSEDNPKRKTGVLIYVGRTTKSRSLALEEFAKQSNLPLGYRPTIISTEEITINGMRGVKQETESHPVGRQLVVYLSNYQQPTQVYTFSVLPVQGTLDPISSVLSAEQLESVHLILQSLTAK